MSSIDKIIAKMRENLAEMSFAEVRRVCDLYFGKSRMHGSHCVCKMPWAGDPRINIQNKSGKVPQYQIAQVLAAIDKMESGNDEC